MVAARDAGRVIPPHPYWSCTRRTGNATQITNPYSREKKLSAGQRSLSRPFQCIPAARLSCRAHSACTAQLTTL